MLTPGIAQYCEPAWRNGRRDGLKIHCSQGCVGSSPTAGTIELFVVQLYYPTITMNQSNDIHQESHIVCRPGCGACCIALSIASLIPPRFSGEQAEPKPAGVACRWLDDEYRCMLYGSSLRPRVCESLKPEREMCGTCREEALSYLAMLEEKTRPE